MTKQLALATEAEHLSDIPQDFRGSFIRQFEEEEQRQNMRAEATTLLSQGEILQFNTALDRIADKLGIGGELDLIDALLEARSARAARVLRAACGGEDRDLKLVE